jgi:hypothetical protein
MITLSSLSLSPPPPLLFLISTFSLLLNQLTIQGKRATGAKRLEGEDPLSHFISIHTALRKAEKELNEKEMHPLMRELKLPYPTSIGRIAGGNWSTDVIGGVLLFVYLLFVLFFFLITILSFDSSFYSTSSYLPCPSSFN